jgi:hypothetical protein
MLHTLHQMHLHRRTGLKLEHLATDLNRVVRGWVVLGRENWTR